ncbi:uncharacterized protein [Amphiura filiformis]|uniref:uncharacterized protein n=1 Tax=Amphiura filiformis TaxID=82378 RepID=UPI003B225D5B
MMRISCITLACVVHVIMLLACHVSIMYSWDVYPNPQSESYRCGRRGRPSWICDPYRILSYSEANEIDHQLSALRNQTQCACKSKHLCPTNSTQTVGYSVSVALMSFIPTSRSQEITVQSYANYLRTYEWRFGQCGDDVVVVYSQLENEIHASVGFKAAIKITERVLEDIILDTRSHFTDDGIHQGLTAFIRKLRNALEDKYQLSPGFPLWTMVQMVMAVCFVFCCFGGMWVCRKLYS